MSDNFLNDFVEGDEAQQNDSAVEETASESSRGTRNRLRAELIKKGYDWPQVQENYGRIQIEDTDGYVKLGVLINEAKDRGIPVSRVVKATGGDRGVLPPLDSRFQLFYHGRLRYVKEELIRDETAYEALQAMSGRLKRDEPVELGIEDYLKAYKKAELSQIAEDHNVEIESKSKKSDIIEALVQSGITVDQLPV